MRKNTKMTNSETPPNPDNEHEQIVRAIAHRLDIKETLLYHQLIENPQALAYADSLIADIDDFLKKSPDGLTSREERDFVLQKLHTAIAISNEPFARDLRLYLLNRYAE